MQTIMLKYGIEAKNVSASTDVPIISLRNYWGWPKNYTAIESFPGKRTTVPFAGEVG